MILSYSGQNSVAYDSNRPWQDQMKEMGEAKAAAARYAAKVAENDAMTRRPNERVERLEAEARAILRFSRESRPSPAISTIGRQRPWGGMTFRRRVS